MLAGDIGRAALFVSMFVIPYVFLASVGTAVTKSARLRASAKAAVILQFILVAVASGALIDLLVTLNFRYTYVAEYTSRGLEVLYRIAAFWGGDAGSLLFWLFIMSVYLLVVRFTSHEGSEQMHPVVTAIMAFVMTFFCCCLKRCGQSLYHAFIHSAKREWSKRIAAKSGDDGASCQSVFGLYRFSHSVCLCHGSFDPKKNGCDMASCDTAMDADFMVVFKLRHHLRCTLVL